MTIQLTGVHADISDFLVNESAALDEHPPIEQPRYNDND